MDERAHASRAGIEPHDEHREEQIYGKTYAKAIEHKCLHHSANDLNLECRTHDLCHQETPRTRAMCRLAKT